MSAGDDLVLGRLAVVGVVAALFGLLRGRAVLALGGGVLVGLGLKLRRRS